MPPLSTNITDNNSETFFILSKLNSDQFTTFASNNAFNNFTVSLLNPSTSPSSVPCKKQKLIAISTWAFSCKLLPYKAIRNGKNKI